MIHYVNNPRADEKTITRYRDACVEIRRFRKQIEDDRRSGAVTREEIETALPVARTIIEQLEQLRPWATQARPRYDTLIQALEVIERLAGDFANPPSRVLEVRTAKDWDAATRLLNQGRAEISRAFVEAVQAANRADRHAPGH